MAAAASPSFLPFLPHLDFPVQHLLADASTAATDPSLIKLRPIERKLPEMEELLPNILLLLLQEKWMNSGAFLMPSRVSNGDH